MNPCLDIDGQRIEFRSHLAPKAFADLGFVFETMDSSVYRPIYHRKESLGQMAAGGGRVAAALLNGRTIIGFAVLDRPNPEERWARLDAETVLELKAVEVFRPFRGHGVARRLLSGLLADSGIEDTIIYLTTYVWIWDLKSSGLTAAAYRDMLLALYRPFGFVRQRTNEPNICLQPENLFMVREGRHVPLEIKESFKLLRFGVLESAKTI